MISNCFNCGNLLNKNLIQSNTFSCSNCPFDMWMHLNEINQIIFDGYCIGVKSGIIYREFSYKIMHYVDLEYFSLEERFKQLKSYIDNRAFE